jgi:ATP-dependent Zn protease
MSAADTKSEERDEDRHTAYHEAGHAVMALALGRPVNRVTVHPNGRFDGLCTFGKAVFRPSEDWVEREILIALAGLAAEAMHTGEYAWDAAEQDRNYVKGLALERAGNARQAERLEKRMLSKAEHILSKEENWQAVERLAAELLRSGEVSGRAARHIYEECQRENR